MRPVGRSGCGQVCAWAVVSAPIRLARCASVIALAAFARIPFAARASGPLPSRAQVAFVASGVLAARLPSAPLLFAGPVLAASPEACSLSFAFLLNVQKMGI